MIVSNKPRGTQDIFPPRSFLYYEIQQIITKILRKNNYWPIIFPTFEYSGLFTTSLGSTTDIIHKEMYTFLDKKGRELALRPEGTASTVRLVCQNKLIREGYPLKLYYWANMFRYERPQKGRYREFWQLGVELVNAQGVIADYQILKLVSDILIGLGIKDFVFSLNYLGDKEIKEKYKKELERFIKKNNPDLCVNCYSRYKTNPLRILDCTSCKSENIYPSYKDVWSSKDSDHVNELNYFLDKFNLPYQYDYRLVRGLDYYTGLVFEVILNQEKALVGGGRYDKLYFEMVDKKIPALGFAFGIDRLVDYLENKQVLKIDSQIDIFFLTLISNAYHDILAWKSELEKYPLIVDYNLKITKLKSLSKIIDRYQPKVLVILGEKELKNGKIIVKDCLKEQVFFVKRENLTKRIIELFSLI
ncbi:histidine--tRNA ligase [endosymbiont GvMRE of Glomus versiforme]|uniref:histidine--tRNA ligase n=1 Tax=endosymbiont GvMRE of Glomus versiforme TaxID=2039283 RepID=UPI000EBB4231|nr:histidine--tRNA ligase [endosymbiont GvMRE of Glomus versiforme]RHZ35497.1 Histidine--tRNA ligase [endosymbiont GvMRE of Glomus versiforme]